MATTAWRQANREKFLATQKRANDKNGEYRRDYYLRQRYGISSEEYDRMFFEQGGACGICGGPPTGGRRLHVDHCHDTGRVRGLLCFSCNTWLGKLQEGWVAKAQAYLAP